LEKGKGEPMMKKVFFVFCALLAVCFIAASVYAEKASEKSGAALFAANCKVCHPNGGNIINPAKTLSKKDREANNVMTAADIIHRMRNPGPGMTLFDAKTISDHDAHEIAMYIMKTFK
jgi:cytochrome c6